MPPVIVSVPFMLYTASPMDPVASTVPPVIVSAPSLSLLIIVVPASPLFLTAPLLRLILPPLLYSVVFESLVIWPELGSLQS